MNKYARFFSIAGVMQWDSVKDDADLNKRVVASMDEDERAQFEDEKESLATPGGFIKFAFFLLVRTA